MKRVMLVAALTVSWCATAGLKTPETSRLFERFVDPQSGVVSYVLKPGSVAHQQQSLYYCIKSMTDDGRFLVFDVYDGRDEVHDKEALSHREFAVVDFLKDEVVRLGPSGGGKHPFPYLDVRNDVLYYFDRGSETLRCRRLLEDPLKEIVLCDLPKEVLAIGRVRGWATHMTMNADCSKVFIEARITPKEGPKKDRRIQGILEVKTGKWTQWSEVDFPANHAALNPKHDDIAYFGWGNYLKMYSERRAAAKKRGETFDEPFLSMNFVNPKGELRRFAPEAIRHATHQTWSEDGTYLYWCSRNMSENKWGVYAIDPWTMKQRCIAPVRAMHAIISGDNRYIVFDWPHEPLGRGSGWETAFYDTVTKKQVFIHSDRPWMADIAKGELSNLHPDAHPHFVCDMKYVVSTFNTDDHRMTVSITPTDQLKAKTGWGISLEVPKSWPCAELSHGNVKAVWLEGEPLKGKPTRVFAYVVLPKGASAERKAPGVVLAHGGAGSAYPSWAGKWASRGYAAIIPDTCGCIPMKAPGGSWIATGEGGPRGWGRTDLVDEPIGDQWPYHAVGAIIRAHSYLRSLPEVDAARTGITGISWGGFLTLLAAATDGRFRFAAPVYACGFYEEFAEYTDFYRVQSYNYGFGTDENAASRLSRWSALFDPKLYVPDIKVPLFWFASAGDRAFPFDTLQKTVALAASARLAVRVGMKHGHGKVGDDMPELYLFADHVLKGAAPLPTVGHPVVKDGAFTVGFDAAGRGMRRVDLVWCTDLKPVYATKWSVRAFDAPAGGMFAAPIPEGATRVYANFIFDEPFKDSCYPDAVVSSAAVRPEM